MTEITFSLLEVDLTNGTSRVVDVTEDVKKYLGGRGLANKLIWDLVPQGADPLGPENILHVGVGPLTGIMGTKTILSFKSPLTGWAGRSSVSGWRKNSWPNSTPSSPDCATKSARKNACN